jgi:hypothetical protein
MVELMPASIEFLRGVVGVLALLFAYMAGRAYIGVRKGRLKQSRFTGWVVRTVLCSIAIFFPQRAVDSVAIAVWALAVVSAAAGAWNASREKPPEDLTETIFPEER